MRPPLRSIDPLRCAVLIEMRGVESMTLLREASSTGFAADDPGACGAVCGREAGVPPGAAGDCVRCVDCAGWLCCVCCCCAVWRCRSICGAPMKYCHTISTSADNAMARI